MHSNLRQSTLILQTLLQNPFTSEESYGKVLIDDYGNASNGTQKSIYLQFAQRPQSAVDGNNNRQLIGLPAQFLKEKNLQLIDLAPGKVDDASGAYPPDLAYPALSPDLTVICCSDIYQAFFELSHAQVGHFVILNTSDSSEFAAARRIIHAPNFKAIDAKSAAQAVDAMRHSSSNVLKYERTWRDSGFLSFKSLLLNLGGDKALYWQHVLRSVEERLQHKIATSSTLKKDSERLIAETRKVELVRDIANDEIDDFVSRLEKLFKKYSLLQMYLCSDDLQFQIKDVVMNGFLPRTERNIIFIDGNFSKSLEDTGACDLHTAKIQECRRNLCTELSGKPVRLIQAALGKALFLQLSSIVIGCATLIATDISIFAALGCPALGIVYGFWYLQRKWRAISGRFIDDARDHGRNLVPQLTNLVYGQLTDENGILHNYELERRQNENFKHAVRLIEDLIPELHTEENQAGKSITSKQQSIETTVN